jgi:hypothetical protein
MIRQLVVAVGLIFSLAVYAEQPDKALVGEAAVAEEKSTATREWLELQRSNRAASSQAQTLSGPALDKIHQRYIDSFARPIPESYDHANPITQ